MGWKAFRKEGALKMTQDIPGGKGMAMVDQHNEG